MKKKLKLNDLKISSFITGNEKGGVDTKGTTNCSFDACPTVPINNCNIPSYNNCPTLPAKGCVTTVDPQSIDTSCVDVTMRCFTNNLTHNC